MQTEIVKIKDIDKQKKDITRAADMLKDGELVAFPTETVYGIAALGLAATAVERLYEAKNRPASKAFSLQVADVSQVQKVAACVPQSARKLMEAFCPGPLTVVLPKAARVPLEATGGRDTVGVRIPDNPVALALLRAVGEPLAVPSANISGHVSPTSAQAVYADMAGRLPLILDGGACRVGIESTIVDCTKSDIRILRQGAISEAEIRRVLAEG